MPYFRAFERTPQGLPILARTWRVGSPSLYLYWLMSFSSQGTLPKSQRSRYSSHTWRASCSWHPRGLSVACVVVEETETCTRPRKLALPEWRRRDSNPSPDLAHIRVWSPRRQSSPPFLSPDHSPVGGLSAFIAFHSDTAALRVSCSLVALPHSSH